jgi:SAM-dependent methyltransferase
MRMILMSPYKPAHEENRMKNEGNVEVARKLFYEKPNQNLIFLLRNRFEWMNQYIDPDRGVGIEVGCGQGFGKEVIRAKSYLLTDFNDYEWLDVKNVDALNTPFDDNSFDFVIASNTIHHFPSPAQFLEEVKRILKPGGFLLIQDVNCSLLMRMMLHLMRIEGYSFDVDIFDKDAIVTDPEDLWSGNNAVPNLLFDDRDRFHQNVPDFKILKSSFSECFVYLASGGVTAKTVYIPLPHFVLNTLKAIDDVLTSLFPQIFALQRQVVLQFNPKPSAIRHQDSSKT